MNEMTLLLTDEQAAQIATILVEGENDPSLREIWGILAQAGAQAGGESRRWWIRDYAKVTVEQ